MIDNKADTELKALVEVARRIVEAADTGTVITVGHLKNLESALDTVRKSLSYHY